MVSLAIIYNICEKYNVERIEGRQKGNKEGNH